MSEMIVILIPHAYFSRKHNARNNKRNTIPQPALSIDLTES